MLKFNNFQEKFVCMPTSSYQFILFLRRGLVYKIIKRFSTPPRGISFIVLKHSYMGHLTLSFKCQMCLLSLVLKLLFELDKDVLWFEYLVIKEFSDIKLVAMYNLWLKILSNTCSLGNSSSRILRKHFPNNFQTFSEDYRR